MNLIESRYLLENNISLTDYNLLLSLIGNNLMGTLTRDHRDIGLNKGSYSRLIHKLQKADLIAPINGWFRINPYFYLHNTVSLNLARKLRQEWDIKNGEYIGAKSITDPISGEVSIYEVVM